MGLLLELCALNQICYIVAITGYSAVTSGKSTWIEGEHYRWLSGGTTRGAVATA